ncbi:hypothetical protein H0I23_15970 [Cellulophaga sp. HaHaR_3_176]|uniref:hypothetical protein n=1 Tax=Cellulophaga sp. HaHaR_3_176 TaxID=1942464 RepID=UPI001C1F9E01|nr:hypothetical protein [Cellulophaga sp. HaHaR_3_176]QWX83926.1 hypothetical protein H0I23_15970 [Cellulophaga sp. HaHaR_3_176]
MSNQKPNPKEKLNFKLPETSSTIKNTDDVARLYKDKNHEVKKALAFKTNADKSKLA